MAYQKWEKDLLAFCINPHKRMAYPVVTPAPAAHSSINPHKRMAYGRFRLYVLRLRQVSILIREWLIQWYIKNEEVSLCINPHKRMAYLTVGQLRDLRAVSILIREWLISDNGWFVVSQHVSILIREWLICKKSAFSQDAGGINPHKRMAYSTEQNLSILRSRACINPHKRMAYNRIKGKN